VRVHHGSADDVLPTLAPEAYDVAFFDGFTPTLDLLEQLHDRLRTGGLLIAGNLILRPKPDVVAYLSDASVWRTHSLGETALCVRED
jgi:predicted O-methyltransferase YrrM